MIERATRELEWLFAAPRRARASVLGEDELDQARALSAGLGALSELRELATAAPELAPGDGPELAQWLERVEVFSGQGPTQGAVAVLDPLALRARRVRALFLCALQEGVFPARARPQPLLAEEERRRLAETSGLRLGEHDDALARERYLLYAAVSRPEELLVLSWHVADDDGDPTARSLFVDDVCDLFDEKLGEGPSVRWTGSARPSRGVASRWPLAEARRWPVWRSPMSECSPSCASGRGRRPRLKDGSAVRCAGSSSTCSGPAPLIPSRSRSPAAGSPTPR